MVRKQEPSVVRWWLTRSMSSQGSGRQSFKGGYSWRKKSLSLSLSLKLWSPDDDNLRQLSLDCSKGSDTFFSKRTFGLTAYLVAVQVSSWGPGCKPHVLFILNLILSPTFYSLPSLSLQKIWIFTPQNLRTTVVWGFPLSRPIRKSGILYMFKVFWQSLSGGTMQLL